MAIVRGRTVGSEFKFNLIPIDSDGGIEFFDNVLKNSMGGSLTLNFFTAKKGSIIRSETIPHL